MGCESRSGGRSGMGGQKCASACEMDGREVGHHMDHVDVHASQL